METFLYLEPNLAKKRPEDRCKIAAEKLGFTGDRVAHVDYKYEWGSSRPQGCFQSDGNDRFHFNKGAGGNSIGDDKILCVGQDQNKKH